MRVRQYQRAILGWANGVLISSAHVHSLVWLEPGSAAAMVATAEEVASTRPRVEVPQTDDLRSTSSCGLAGWRAGGAIEASRVKRRCYSRLELILAGREIFDVERRRDLVNWLGDRFDPGPAHSASVSSRPSAGLLCGDCACRLQTHALLLLVLFARTLLS